MWCQCNGGLGLHTAAVTAAEESQCLIIFFKHWDKHSLSLQDVQILTQLKVVLFQGRFLWLSQRSVVLNQYGSTNSAGYWSFRRVSTHGMVESKTHRWQRTHGPPPALLPPLGTPSPTSDCRRTREEWGGWVFRLFLVAKWVSKYFHHKFLLSVENHSFVWKRSLFVFIDTDPIRWTGRLGKPRCGLRSILRVTDRLPKDTPASGLKVERCLGAPESLHFLQKESCP